MQYCNILTPPGLKMLSRDKHLRTSVWDTVPRRRVSSNPAAHASRFRGADKITIHEDTHGERQFDKHKTFVDGLSIGHVLARGPRRRVYVLNLRHTCFFYADRTTTTFHLATPRCWLKVFGLEDTHSGANQQPAWGRTAGSTPPRLAR